MLERKQKDLKKYIVTKLGKLRFHTKESRRLSNEVDRFNESILDALIMSRFKSEEEFESIVNSFYDLEYRSFKSKRKQAKRIVYKIGGDLPI